MRGLASLTLLLSTPLLSVAHSGKEAEAELALRKRFLEIHTNNLDHCAGKLQARGYESLRDRAAKRRAEKVASLMGVTSAEAAIHARQLSSISKSHKSTKDFNAKTDPATVFADSNSCVLSPETTEGPFYILGQDIRTEIVEGQAGIPLHLDIQVIDVQTCKPIPNTFIEMWNANGTGVYSGALAVVNGLSGMNDKSLLNKNFLRGAQMTDKDGVAQFQTIFPGHYDGRAPHIHVISHLNATARANNTIWDSKVTHVGQVFFDQDLVNNVKKVAPYSTNKQNLLQNAADNILLQEAATADPFFNYVQLGSSLEKDGIFAWFSFGVNQTFTREVMSVAMRYKEGNKMVTTNPKVPGLDAIFPGGFPTAYNPGMGGFGGGGGGARPTGRP